MKIDYDKFTDLRQASKSLELLPDPKPPRPAHLVEHPPGVHTFVAFHGNEKRIRVAGNVYFLRCGEFVKIGCAASVAERVRAIATMNPHPLELLAIVKGGRDEEKALHRRFAHLRHRDEWFRYEGDLADYIRELRGE